jgi:hypothetical protein
MAVVSVGGGGRGQQGRTAGGYVDDVNDQCQRYDSVDEELCCF